MQTIQVNIHEAKSRLSELVNLAEEGNEVILARYNEPIMKLTPIKKKKQRVLGSARGSIKFIGDPDEPLPNDIIESFYNSKLEL